MLGSWVAGARSCPGPAAHDGRQAGFWSPGEAHPWQASQQAAHNRTKPLNGRPQASCNWDATAYCAGHEDAPLGWTLLLRGMVPCLGVWLEHWAGCSSMSVCSCRAGLGWLGHRAGCQGLQGWPCWQPCLPICTLRLVLRLVVLLQPLLLVACGLLQSGWGLLSVHQTSQLLFLLGHCLHCGGVLLLDTLQLALHFGCALFHYMTAAGVNLLSTAGADCGEVHPARVQGAWQPRGMCGASGSAGSTAGGCRLYGAQYDACMHQMKLTAHLSSLVTSACRRAEHLDSA